MVDLKKSRTIFLTFKGYQGRELRDLKTADFEKFREYFKKMRPQTGRFPKGVHMEKIVYALIQVTLTTALMSGGGFALQRLVKLTQQDAKGAMKMGISYSRFNQ